MGRPLLGEEEKNAVLGVLDSGMLAQGPKVKEFEKAFASYIEVKHAIATSNGTTALHTALLAHGIGKGDEVITSPFSFIATANTIAMTGATPVFVDVEEGSFMLDAAKVENVITSKTKAVMPVHLFGRVAAMDQLQKIAAKHDLLIIEDACQAHGATFFGKKAGSFGTGCFSFYPTKNITTGEGGIITTNDDAVAEKARLVLNHGSRKKYYHEVMGYNYRMTDIAAALGIVQLQKLDQFNRKRREHARYYIQQLKSLPGIVVPSFDDGHVFHQFTLRVTSSFPRRREEIIEFLASRGIATSVFYPMPIHQQQPYAHSNGSFPIAERLSQEVLSLPIYPILSEREREYIVQSLKLVLQGEQ